MKNRNIALLLASVTIVYGSTMAVKEHHFKRRLAYSSVSNLSYIVLAASLMTQSGLTASLAHMLFHALIKITLFFCAGAVLVKTERTQIEDLRGMAKVMPFTCATYTIGAISLMGTPLLPGFVSKWLIGSAAIAGHDRRGGDPHLRRADRHLPDGAGAVDVLPPAGGHGADGEMRPRHADEAAVCDPGGFHRAVRSVLQPDHHAADDARRGRDVRGEEKTCCSFLCFSR